MQNSLIFTTRKKGFRGKKGFLSRWMVYYKQLNVPLIIKFTKCVSLFPSDSPSSTSPSHEYPMFKWLTVRLQSSRIVLRSHRESNVPTTSRKVRKTPVLKKKMKPNCDIWSTGSMIAKRNTENDDNNGKNMADKESVIFVD